MTALCAILMCLSLSVSAYSNADGAPPYEGLTASGAQTTRGIAACGPAFPFGTVMLVGGRLVVCLDRGGAITNGHLDLYMEEGAKQWGRRVLPVVVLR